MFFLNLRLNNRSLKPIMSKICSWSPKSDQMADGPEFRFFRSQQKILIPPVTERGDKCCNQSLSPPSLKGSGGDSPRPTDVPRFSSRTFPWEGKWRCQTIHSCWCRGNHITVCPAKLILEIFSPTVEPLMPVMNELSISNACEYTNRSSLPAGVAH